LKCVNTSFITPSATGNSLFLEVFCNNSTQEYLVYSRRKRLYIQEFIRYPRPRFGKLIYSVFLCAECNYFYYKNKNRTKNIDIYGVKCIELTQDEWSQLNSINDFMRFINEKSDEVISELATLLRQYFFSLVDNIGTNLEKCCGDDNGPALFFSCVDRTTVSYKRPRLLQTNLACFGDTHKLYPTSEIEPGEECVQF